MGAEQSAPEPLAPRPVKRGGAGGTRGAKSLPNGVPGMGDGFTPLAPRPATVTGAGACIAMAHSRAANRVAAAQAAAG